MDNISCKCGNGITHPKVIHKTEYSSWGWFLFTILGLSAKPKKVSFTCTKCKETFLVSTNKEILNKYVGR